MPTIRRSLFVLTFALVLAARLAGQAAGPGATLGSRLDLAGVLLGLEGFTRVDNGGHAGALRRRRSEEFDIVLRPGGGYVVVGVCDSDCGDLDVAVLAADGSTVAEDVLTDAIPMVRVQPVQGGRYRVRVTMYQCSVAPCAYRVGIFGRDPDATLDRLGTAGRSVSPDRPASGQLTADDLGMPDGSFAQAWALEGERGQAVTIDLVSNDFDAFLVVVGPGLDQPLMNDDGGGACHARISLTFQRSGVFVVLVNSVSRGETGRFTLRVSAAPGPKNPRRCGQLPSQERSVVMAATFHSRDRAPEFIPGP